KERSNVLKAVYQFPTFIPRQHKGKVKGSKNAKQKALAKTWIESVEPAPLRGGMLQLFDFEPPPYQICDSR
ncbi:MAG: hypothetical protein WBV25_07200, partial [Methylocella sp.]